MHHDIMNFVIDQINTKQCLRDIAQYWSFRSTVPGPGLRKASEFLCQRHRENGIKAEVIPYPADDKTEWLHGHRNPLEWIPRRGKLSILKPEGKSGLICSYAEEPLSLVCNSTSTSIGGDIAEVLIINSGDKDESYTGVNVAGKIIFTELPANSVASQARKRGAIGVISDCISPPWLTSHPPVREPEDAPDLTMWSVFGGSRNEKNLWGFSLSARQGRRLREIIRESKEPVILHAEVDADLVPGTSELVNAFLPGTDLAHEEIWVLAHSSEPGARDNASGCCLSLELARILKLLLETGELPPLRRSIRFMNAVEVSGFLPYIDDRSNELDNVLAGLCLDSVGQDFSICGGEFVLFQSPETDASFIDGLMEHIFSAVALQPISRFSTDNYAIFPWHTEPFWGNDAFVSDGFFDIPTPQISTWPDKFYHSSMDTPDQMSENTLGRAGAICGTLLYLLSTAGPREALWFAGLASRDWKRRICHELTMEASKMDKTSISERVNHLQALGKHLGLQARDAIVQVTRFGPNNASLKQVANRKGEEIKEFAYHEAQCAIELALGLSGSGETISQNKAIKENLDNRKDIVFKRLKWRSPVEEDFSIDNRGKLRSLREKYNVNRIWSWINGHRTVEEIWERVQFGGHIPYEIVADYMQILADQGNLLSIQKRNA